MQTSSCATDSGRYKVIRFYRDRTIPARTIKTGLTLAQAQAHCANPETSSSTAKGTIAKRRTRDLGPWFDGYEHM